MIELLAAILITGGPANHTLQEFGNIFGVQVLFDWQDDRQRTNTTYCRDCTPLQFLRFMLPDSLELSQVDEITFTIHPAPKYCAPELGAQAPLPPCLPKPHRSRGGHR